MPTRRTILLSAATLLAVPARAAAAPLDLRRLYNPDRSFSDLARALDGTEVRVPGFMAPPLKAQSRFFVLAMRPMSSCPFCDVDTEWPDDIIAVYARDVVEMVEFYHPIEARGILRLDPFTDPETDFVSQARIEDAAYSRT